MITTQQADEIQELCKEKCALHDVGYISMSASIGCPHEDDPFELYVQKNKKCKFGVFRFKTIEEVITCLREL